MMVGRTLSDTILKASANQMTQPITFITGGSGLVGSGLLQRLAAGSKIILTRQPGVLSADENISAVKGDLCRDDLGLDASTAELLCRRVTEIIHCAADIRFTSTIEAARAVNTQGTRRLLDFAEQCPHLTKFAHISTLYVAGRRPGLVREEALRHDCGYFNVYTQSKHEAEALVLERMARLPISIFRLSSIIGNSVTGRVSQANYFHSLIRLMPRAQDVVRIPGDPSAPVDLIADDWATSALAFLFERHFTPGRIHHLCAGPTGSLTAEALFELAFRIYNHRRGTNLRPPQMASLDSFQRFGDHVPAWADRPAFQLLSTFLPHLAVNQPFDPGQTGELLASGALQPPPVASFVERVVRRVLS